MELLIYCGGARGSTAIVKVGIGIVILSKPQYFPAHPSDKFIDIIDIGVLGCVI